MTLRLKMTALLSLCAFFFFLCGYVSEADAQARRGVHARSQRETRRARAYRQRMTRIHTRASRSEIERWKHHGEPLELRAFGSSATVEIEPPSSADEWPDSARVQAMIVLAAGDDARAQPCLVHPRLLSHLHAAQRQFDAPHVWIVSGYRNESRSSRHGQCLAADVVLPGVSDDRLARFFRERGFVGVGIYPNSRFVHVDVRRRSYFWVDRSGPGQRSRTRPIMARAAELADRRARARNVTPPEFDAAGEQLAHSDGADSEGDTAANDVDTEARTEAATNQAGQRSE